MLIMFPYMLNMAEALSWRIPTMVRSWVTPYSVTSMVSPVTSVVPNSFFAACWVMTQTRFPA